MYTAQRWYHMYTHILFSRIFLILGIHRLFYWDTQWTGFSRINRQHWIFLNVSGLTFTAETRWILKKILIKTENQLNVFILCCFMLRLKFFSIYFSILINDNRFVIVSGLTKMYLFLQELSWVIWNSRNCDFNRWQESHK